VPAFLALALAGAFSLTSPAFNDGGVIPRHYTCKGADVSPPLRWGNPPEDTRSFVLVVDDPDAPGRTWLHWLVYDIPPGLRQLGEDASRRGIAAARQGRNDFGRAGYGGPCPPSGTHRYHFRLRAIDIGAAGLRPGASLDELERKIDGHVLDETVLIGTFSR
jgi:Raf kinase inhibitor-like YbhB/YbcL family protein